MNNPNENTSLTSQPQERVKSEDWIDVLATSLVWMKRHKAITAIAVLLLIGAVTPKPTPEVLAERAARAAVLKTGEEA